MEFRRVSVEWCLIIGAGSILTRETSRYGLGKGVAPLEMPKLWEVWGAFRFPLSSLNPASQLPSAPSPNIAASQNGMLWYALNKYPPCDLVMNCRDMERASLAISSCENFGAGPTGAPLSYPSGYSLKRPKDFISQTHVLRVRIFCTAISANRDGTTHSSVPWVKLNAHAPKVGYRFS
jgi:hypothetical protein